MTASNWEVSAENRPHKVLLWVHTIMLGLFWMMTASNWEVSAENQPHKVLLWVHTNAWVVLDDDGLKLGSFGRKSASQSVAFESILMLGLFWMMTASNWEVSAENRPHKVLLWVHSNAWVVLDDDGLKLGSFGRKSASQSAALSPY